MNTGQQHRDKNENARCHGKMEYSGRQTLKSKNWCHDSLHYEGAISAA